MTAIINELNSKILEIGNKICNTSGSLLLITYNEVATYCKKIGDTYIIDRPVYIPTSYWDKFTQLQKKDKNKFTVNDYFAYCGNSNIQIDKYLKSAIDDGEFRAYLQLPFKCPSGAINIDNYEFYTYNLAIERKKFGDPSVCCLNGGMNYYNNETTSTFAGAQAKYNIVLYDDKKYTCGPDEVQINITCDQYVGDINRYEQCKYENETKRKTICMSELKKYCMTSGVNVLEEGIARMIDYDTNKLQARYPRCNVDFKKIYPNEYNDMMDQLCNKYDNRNNIGYTHYKKNPLCVKYCAKKTLSDCFNKCYPEKLSSEEYQTEYYNLSNNICPPTSDEPNGNLDCINNLENRIEKKNLDNKYSQICLGECSDKIFNGEISSCKKADEQFCLRNDYDMNGNVISRVFTNECQDILSHVNNFSQYLEQYCIMDKKNILYNTPQCNDFRNEYNKCILDSRINNNNNLVKPICKDFWDKYKTISDIRFYDLCEQNPFITKCSDVTFKDSNDINDKGSIFAESMNNRFAKSYNKSNMYDMRTKNQITDEYLTNFCLDNYTTSINECNNHISKTLDKRELVEYCTDYDNIYKKEICRKIVKNVPDNFENSFGNICIETNSKFDTCSKKKEFCDINKKSCIKNKVDCTNDYNTCINQYKAECNEYDICYNGMNQPDKRKECLRFKKKRQFYLTKECEDIRFKTRIKQGIIIIIIISILIFFVVAGIKIYIKYFKNR